REPALTAKMATTLDHISGGRAILGIGAAWFEAEHVAYGLPFGSGAPERLRWLREALPVMRGMLSGETPSSTGERYHVKAVRNLPAPIQQRLPLLIGGGGEKVTLRLVARYADACNIGGGIHTVRRKETVPQEHCRPVGRDHREIEPTTVVGAGVIRSSTAEAQRVFERLFASNGGARPWTNQPVGPPDEVAAAIRPYLDIGPGYRHLLAGFPAPYDEESMTRFAREVRPRLEDGLRR